MVNEFFRQLYSSAPQLHTLDILTLHPTRVFIIELALFTIVLCLFLHRRNRIMATMNSYTREDSRYSDVSMVNEHNSVLTGQIASFDNRLKSLEHRLESINHDMTALVEHLMSHPGEPLRVKPTIKTVNGAGLHSNKRQ